MFTFGSGTLWGISNASGTPTPIKFGTLQEVGVDISFNKKELFGGKQFAKAVARSTGKIACKAKFANINGKLLNELFFGANAVTGNLLIMEDETSTIPDTPNQITVSKSSTFAEDLGVFFSDTGIPLIKVASAPAVGQYSCANGVYTFNTSDKNLAVSISYVYNDTTSGTKIVVSNQNLGTSPFFTTWLTTGYKGKQVTMKLHSCMSSKLGLSTKLEDFSIPELDFDAMADEADKVLTLSIA